MVPVHEKIQELLTWNGISQYRLAELAGIPKGSIGGYVSGKTPISLELLGRLANALGVSPWVLINGSNLPASNMDLTPEEQALITDLRHLPQGARRIISTAVKAMVEEYGRP